MSTIEPEQLFRAIHAGDEARVRDILTSRPDLLNAWLTKANAWHANDTFDGESHGSRGFRAAPGLDPLAYATRRNAISVVRVLLTAGATVEALSFEGNMGWTTPLHHAAFASNEHAAIVECLLDHGATPNVISSTGSTPIQTAAEHGESDVVALLERAGATIDIHVAAMLGRVEAVQGFLDASPAWLEALDSYRQATLLFFAAGANAAAVIRHLAARGASLDTPDNFGWSPVLYAVSMHGGDALLALVELGADLHFTSTTDRWGLPAGSNVLHAALRSDLDAATIETLLAAGADATHRDDACHRPVDVARERGNDALIGLLTP